MTREELLHLIETNDTVAVSALLSLYKRQTAEEQLEQRTNYDNGVGFNALDANILSSFAQQAIKNRTACKRGEQCYPTDLSPKQLALLRKRLPKYARQLEHIAAEKAANKPEQGLVQPVVSEQVEGPKGPSLPEQDLVQSPAFEQAFLSNGVRVSKQFVYTPDGAIIPRSTKKIVAKAVAEHYGTTNLPKEAALPPDPLDEFFA